MLVSHEITMKNTLPEELVEKIISMMPYPSIFKARALSTSWYTKFKPISHLEDDHSKWLVKSFHKGVAERSHNWGTFGPVWVSNYVYPGEDVLIVYNQMTKKWQKLPSLWPTALFQARTHVQGTFMRMTRNDSVLLEGAFFYGTWIVPGFRQDMHVGNFLTREWKQLPIRPEAHHNILAMKLVINPSSETYKVVVLVSQDKWPNRDYGAQIFDSKSSTWSSKVLVPSIANRHFYYLSMSYAYLNGIFYKVGEHNWLCLLAFDVEEGAVQELRLSSTHEAEFEQVRLVVCNGNLVMIVVEKQSKTVRVLKVDLVSLQLLEVAQCFATSKLDVINTHDMISTRVIGADCMFFKIDCMFFNFFITSLFNGRILQYNKLKDE